MSNDGIGILVLAAFIFVWVFFAPLALIWALNTLFGLTITYSLETWMAALIIELIIGSKSKTSKK
jgi:hypothetical protein